MSKNLRHANGLPVECVIADTCIGGAPVTQDFADKFGADGFASDASSATRVAKELLDVA